MKEKKEVRLAFPHVMVLLIALVLLACILSYIIPAGQYEYDSNGRLGKETYYRADGIGVYYNAYSYTEDGVIAEMDYASAKEGSTRTLYDEEGKESKRMTYDINDELVKYEEFADGDWVEKPLPTESTDPTEADAE